MKVLANDSITLTKIIDGADGTNSISVILSSYAINLPSNSEGAIIDYSNSQVNIIVLEGQKSLIPTLSTSLNNGQFRLKNTTLKNIGSIAQQTIDKDKIKTGVISQFASNQDSGSAEFEIEYKTSTGDINTVNMTLTFTKAKQGLAGTPGKDGKPVFTSIRYSNEICDRENFIPTTATINPNADTFSIGIYTGEIDYDSPNNHWEQNLDKYKWSAYGQQSIKEIKTTFKATSSMNKPNSIDFRDDNIPSDFNAQNKYLWKKDVYYYNGTNTTTESINLIATYGKDGQSANTLSATSGSYSINKSEVIITGNSAHTDALNSTGTNLFVYNYDGSLAEKINYNTYSDPNLCNTLLTKIQGLRDKIFVLMECDSGSMTQQLRNELILSGGSQTDIWNKQRRAWIFISLSKKSTNNQYPLQKGQAYEVSNIGDNKKESLTVSLTGSGIVANGSTGIGITSIQTKYQATNSASKPTQGWGDSIWSTTIPALTDDKKYLYSITRYTYSDNRTTDIIDLISVKGSDGENGKILYQDTVPVAPSIGTQWFNTGTNNGYINNTLYVFDGQNWEVMEFSAENIKTSVLNALQANMDNTNVSHKLIVGNKTGKRVELDGYNGTLTIYNSNNQKVFYTGADGNLNFQGNLSFSSGSSVSQAIDKKADTSFVNNKVDSITSSDVNNLFIDSEFYNLDAIKSNWYRSNLKILENENYAGSRVLYWNGTGASWGYLQFQSVIIPYTLNDKVTVGFNYRYSTEDQFLASFYFMNADSSKILKKHEVWFKGSAEQANTWQTFNMTADIPNGTDHIDFKIFAQGSKILNFSRPRIYAGSVDWGYNINPVYSQNQIENKVDGEYVEDKIDNISVGGTNLLSNTSPMPTLVSFPATQDSTMDGDWQKFTTNISGKEVLPKDNAKYSLQLQANMDIVQSIMVQTDGQINSAQFTFYDTAHHIADAKIKLISDGNGVKTYQLWCSYKTNGNKFRCIDLKTINYTGNYIKFKHPMVEQGTVPTNWNISPNDNVQSDSQNILTTTGNMKTFISPATTANGEWRKAGGTGGNGKFIIKNDNPPMNGIISSFKIINESTDYNDSVVAQDAQTYEIGQDYVLSCYARKLTDSSHSGNPKLRLQTYGVGGLQGNIEVSNTSWQQFYITGKATQTNGNCYFGNINPSSIIEICGMKLEKGTKPTAWSPNPLDSSVSINETNKDLNNQLKNRENLWPNQTFEEGLLSDFTTISNNDNSVQIVVNGVKNSVNESPKDFGVEYKKQNSSNKSLRLNGRTDGNRDCFLQSKYAIDVSDGEIFNISFDFYKQSGTNATVGLQALDINNKTIQWLDSIRVNNNNGGNWWHKDGQITIPIGKGIVKVIPYVSLFKGQSSDYVYIDNITITRQTKKEQSIETQINQTKDKISLIADIKENENDLNPDAAINVYIDKSQPEGHQGTVSIGANNKFLIRADTEVEKNFKLSANNISAGFIEGNSLSWYKDINTPTIFKENEGAKTKAILNLQSGSVPDSKLTQEFFLSGISIMPNSVDDDSKWSVIETSYNQSGLFFTDYTWLKNNPDGEVHQASSSGIFGYHSVIDDSVTGVKLKSGAAELVIEDVYARTQLSNSPERQYVQIGKTKGGTPALSTPVLYAPVINGRNDEQDAGVRIDDKLLLNEGVWSDWSVGGKQTGINFPNKNSGDIIELHTAEGDKNGSWFSFINGNWDIKATTKTPKGQKHAIVPAGNGYTIAFSNTETDNAQGDASATIIAKEYLTTSSKELKDKIEPINNIEQAVEDILKIEPKQYYYKTQLEKIKEWEEKGKPENEYENLDTEINIGFIAEDLEAYNSLRPFITKATDDYGNEGILGIDYSKFVPLLLAVCQKQDNKINQLEEQIVRLELLMNKNF